MHLLHKEGSENSDTTLIGRPKLCAVMNVVGIALGCVLAFVVVDAANDWGTAGSRIPWYCRQYHIGCPAYFDSGNGCGDNPLLMKDDDEAGVAVSRDTIDEILCRDWGLRCVSSNCDDAAPLSIGTPCDQLALAATTLYAYLPFTAGVIRKEAKKLEKQLEISFMDKTSLADKACEVASAENLSELAAALNLSVKELKAKNRRLQRKALSKCKKFVVGMLFLSEAAKSDTRTQLAAKAMKVFCATIANIGLFAMDS